MFANRGWLAPLTLVSSHLEAERERWILWVPVAMAAGIGSYFLLADEPAWGLVSAALLASAAIAALATRGTLPVALAGLLLWGSIGFGLAKLRTSLVDAPQLTAPTRSLSLVGVVERNEPRQPSGSRLTLLLETVDGRVDPAMPRRVRIRSQPLPAGVEIGDRVAVTAVLLPLPGPVLPDSYDFARTAWFDGIGASGFAVTPPAVAAAGRASTVPRDSWHCSNVRRWRSSA